MFAGPCDRPAQVGSCSLLVGIGVTAFLLLGLSPVTLFFVLTSSDYAFFQLIAVVFVAISGYVGLYFLWNGMTYMVPLVVMRGMALVVLFGTMILTVRAQPPRSEKKGIPELATE